MTKLKKFRKKVVIWTMVLTFLLVCGLGLGFGTVVEETLAGEIAKWIIGGAGVSCITGFFAFIIAPVVWHAKYGDEEIDEEGSPIE